MFKLNDRVRYISTDEGEWYPRKGALGAISKSTRDHKGKWVLDEDDGYHSLWNVLWDDPLPNGQMEAFYFRHRLEKRDDPPRERTPQDNFAELTGFEEVD